MSSLVATTAYPASSFHSTENSFAFMPLDASGSIVELSDEELEDINGSVAPLAIYAVRIGGGAVVGGIAGGVASAINGQFSWRAVGAGAAAGAIGGAWGGWLKIAAL